MSTSEKTKNANSSLPLDRSNGRSRAKSQGGPVHADVQPAVRLDMDSGTLPIHRISAEEGDAEAESFVGRDNGAGILNVRWNWWRISQSQYRYRAAGEIDLGEIK
jgi:hypothetical protein